MSQADLVKELKKRGRKVGVRTLVDWERPEGEEGQRDPPSWFVAELAAITGEDPGWLISGTSSPAHAKLEAIRRILDDPQVISGASDENPYYRFAIAGHDRLKVAEDDSNQEYGSRKKKRAGE